MSNSEFLKVAIEAAKKSEKVIMDYFNGEFDVKMKSDMTPVTQADVDAEKTIVGHIKENFPDHGFIGEESGTSNQDSEYLWIIDPIDGTKNFARKLPFFATQIALMKNGELIAGVSNAPALREFLYAEKGKGAFLNEKQVNVSSIEKIDESYLTYGGIDEFETSNLLPNFISLFKKTHAHRGFGDCWSYSMLAQGKTDIMVEAAVAIWDIAAVTVIVQEAGGKVTDLEGNPIVRESKHILATNGKLHNEVLGYFSE